MMKTLPIPEIEGLDYLGEAGRGSRKGAHYYLDSLTGTRYAIKFDEPTEEGIAKQEERGYSDETILRKEFFGGNGTQYAHVCKPVWHGRTRDGKRFTVEEPAEMTLGQYLEKNKRPLPLEEVIHIATHMVDGMKDVHFYDERAHQDLKPDNIFLFNPHPKKTLGSALDAICKVADWGNASRGSNGILDVGYIGYRAPEMFSTVNNEKPKNQREASILKKRADIYSIGVMLFQMFTGKVPFDAELSHARSKAGWTHLEHPDDPRVERINLLSCYSAVKDQLDPTFVKEMNEKLRITTEENFAKSLGEIYQNPHRWNKSIDDRIEKANIPKPFKSLVKRSLYHHQSTGRNARIANGVELADALTNAVVQYQKTLPKAKRMRRVKTALAAGILFTIAASVYGGFQSFASMESNYSEQVQSARLDANFEKKLRIIRLQQSGDYSKLDWSEQTELGELRGWIQKFTHEGIETFDYAAYAAYLDANPIPKSVYKAIQMNNGDAWEKTLRPIVEDINPKLYYALEQVTNGITDNASRMISSDRALAVPLKWEAAAMEYQDDIHALKDQYLQREHEQDRWETFTYPQTRTGDWGGTHSEKSRIEKEKDLILGQLSGLTHKQCPELTAEILQGDPQAHERVQRFMQMYKEAEDNLDQYDKPLYTSLVSSSMVDVGMLKSYEKDKKNHALFKLGEMVAAKNISTVETMIKEDSYPLE